MHKLHGLINVWTSKSAVTQNFDVLFRDFYHILAGIALYSGCNIKMPIQCCRHVAYLSNDTKHMVFRDGVRVVHTRQAVGPIADSTTRKRNYLKCCTLNLFLVLHVCTELDGLQHIKKLAQARENITT